MIDIRESNNRSFDATSLQTQRYLQGLQSESPPPLPTNVS